MFRNHHIRLLFAFLFCLSSGGIIGQQSIDDKIKLGDTLNYQGYYDSARQVLIQARNTFIGQKDSVSPKLYYKLGYSFLNLGKCDSAELVINKGLDKAAEDSQRADGYHVLARALAGCSNQRKEARKFLHRSITIKENLYGSQSLEVSFDYNLMGYIYHFSAMYDSALFFLDKALAIRMDHPGIDPVELSATYLYLGKVYERKGDLKLALNYGQRSLNVRRKLLRPDHPSTSNSLSDVGNVYKRFGNHESALKYFQQGLEIRKRTLGEQHINVAASYYSMGTLYGNMFDYRGAIPFIEQGNLIVKNKFGEQTPVLHTYYAYLGRMYHMSGNGEKAAEMLNHSLELSEKYLPDNHPYRAIIYNVLGEYYGDNNELDFQQSFLSKALGIYRNKGNQTISEAAVLFELGKASMTRDDFDQAKAFFDESVTIYKERLGHKNDEVSTVHKLFGDLKKKQGDLVGALGDYWKSLETLSYEEIDRSIEFDLSTLTHKQKALSSLHRIANAYVLLYYQSSKIEDLEYALKIFEKGIELMDLIASEFQLEDSRTQLANDTKSFFNDAVKTAFELHHFSRDDSYKEKLFFIIEKSKSPVLSARIQENEARRFSRVPDSLITKERDLRVELTYFKGKLRDAKAANDEKNISFYQTEMFQTQNAYEQFKEELKQRYSDYYTYKYSSEVIGLAELIEIIDQDETVIEYYEGKDVIYAFKITKAEVSIYKQAISEDFNKALEGYQKSLTDNMFIVDKPEQADSMFVASSYHLFKTLMDPIGLSSENKKIVIIPDGRLTKLNFGLQITEPSSTSEVKYDELNYLLAKYTISYAHSATLNSKEASSAPNRYFAGFAPSYKSSSYSSLDSNSHPMTYALVRDGNLPLPGAIAEVKEINDFLNGKIWLEEEASESNFKLNVGAYSIVHLAMHSLLNDTEPEFSELLFNNQKDSLNDGYLTIDEIYNLNLNASMVVLSACSSGSGALQVGEGPISFSRAFSYAGCPSIVMSLWKLPDEATHQIMVDFYRNIKAGDDKDVALRKAQLSYVQTTDDPLYKHPFFWGSFVVLGNTQPVLQKEFKLSYLFLIVGILLLGGFLIRKKMRSA